MTRLSAVDGLSRRGFLVRAAAMVALAPSAGWTVGPSRAAPTLRIGLLNSSTTNDDPQSLGFRLGVDEAKHSAEMFGGTIEVIPLRDAVRIDGLSALIGNRCESGVAMEIPLLNVGCADDELREARCRRRLYHIAPSSAMARDAIAMVQVPGTAVAWHPLLSRFGADTLNRRFQSRFNREMTAESWTAWLAIKILWESSLRVRSGDPDRIADYLTRDGTQFDGHKGLPLSFRSWDRQLRQPMYVVTDSGVVEVPTGTAKDSPRDLLDRLGTGSKDSGCRASS